MARKRNRKKSNENKFPIPRPVQVRPQQSRRNHAPAPQGAGAGSGGSGGHFVRLSDCAREWAATLANPFDAPAGACIPNFPACMTRRLKVWSKGTFSTSTVAGPALGRGFIVLSPLRGCANDQTWVNFSTAASTSATIDVVPAVGVQGAGSNSDYVTAQFGPGDNLLQPRLVAAGLRIRYIGEKLAQGGQAIGLTEPTHFTLLGDNDADLNGFAESKRLPISMTEWSTLLYRHVDNKDLEFHKAVFPAAYGSEDNIMAFYLVAPNNPVGGVGQITMEFEAYAHYEVQGRNARGRVPSHVDYTGFAAVHAATQLSPTMIQPSQKPAAAMASTFVNAAVNYLGTSTSIVQAHPSAIATVSANQSPSAGFPWKQVGEKILGWAGDMVLDMLM